MAVIYGKSLAILLAGSVALAAMPEPAHSRDGFATGAIVGGLAGLAVGAIIANGVRPRNHYEPRPRATNAAREDVSTIQKALNAFGFDAGPVTGKMNAQTKAAIGRYQAKVGDRSTGTLTDDQKSALLTVYAKRNQDDNALSRTSKIDALFMAIGVSGAGAAPVVPAANPALPNFSSGTTAAVDMPTSIPASMRTVCREDQTTAMRRETAADVFKSVKLVPDQFCVARSNVLADAAEAYKAMSAQPNAAKPDVVRAECQRFAEAKAADIEKLASAAPSAYARAFVKPNTKPGENDASIKASHICLGFGYADDKADVVLASALVLVGFGETGYGELIGAGLALGVGVPKDVTRGGNWLEFTAAEIDAGASSVVKSDGVSRAKVLRQVIKEMQSGSNLAAIAVKADAAPVAPNFFATREDTPKTSIPPSKSDEAKFGGESRAAGKSEKLGRDDLVDQLRDNVVLIYTDEGMGTGFFISPTQVLTNTHVVSGANKVLLVNKSIRTKAGIVKYRGMTTAGGVDTGIDAAIVEVVNYRHPTFLTFATNVREGEDIAIAGFPVKALTKDRGFNQFLELIRQSQLPTASQIPNTKFAFGVVQSVFTHDRTGLENIQEGVETTGGNSGSPLTNECGQVVALHYETAVTKVAAAGQGLYVDPSKYNFAISFREVIKFLRDAGVPYQAATEPCRGARAAR